MVFVATHLPGTALKLLPKARGFQLCDLSPRTRSPDYRHCSTTDARHTYHRVRSHITDLSGKETLVRVTGASLCNQLTVHTPLSSLTAGSPCLNDVFLRWHEGEG
jgi:hypothetical protein